MRLALAALLLIGCREHEDFDPIGGGPGGMTGKPDAAPDSGTDADGGSATGRVCALQDLRQLTTCDDTGVLGVVVSIASAQTTTADNGAFTLDVPAGTGLVWNVTDPDFMTSVQQLSNDLTLPAIRTDDYAELLGTNGIILTAGQSSSVVLRVLDDNGNPVVGAIVTSDPVAQFPTRYDGTSATTWDQDSTGAFGVAWLPGTVGSTARLTVTPPPGGGAARQTDVPLVPDQITFATISF